MATKIAAVAAVILMLAAIGAVGVAFYNDPSILEGAPAPASPVQQTTPSGCCSMTLSTPDCAAPAAAAPSCCEK